ncbi:MAG TPA: ATP-binding protein [Burkholderiaceae bacterium]|nr:ATP-binding protein [Burkholderiaceae bacterium]
MGRDACITLSSEDQARGSAEVAPNHSLAEFREDYLNGLRLYLLSGGESALNGAYELGRRALLDGLGLLEVVALHHAAIDTLILDGDQATRARRAHAAAAYFNEMLSPFELSLRGYRVANEQMQQLNQTLRQQLREIETVNRELESFSYSVSHDLRAPLRGIDGLSQLLLEHAGTRLDATGKRYLRLMREATSRMEHLISDLLNLARVTTTQIVRTDVDLSAIVRSIADRLHTADPARQVEFAIQPGVRAQCDARLLAVMLENLIGNAWKFTSKSASARIEFSCGRGDGAPVYCVRDNGAGFDMAHASKLFQPFSRLHSMKDFEGTGIGLATVQRIVRRHHGEIWGVGALKEGARFFFTLEPGPHA